MGVWGRRPQRVEGRALAFIVGVAQRAWQLHRIGLPNSQFRPNEALTLNSVALLPNHQAPVISASR